MAAKRQTGKGTGTGTGTGAGKAPKKSATRATGVLPSAKRRALPREIADETDPQWRAWFQEVERRKKALSDPKRGAFVVADFDKDGVPGRVARQKSLPLRIGKLMKTENRKTGGGLHSDLLLAAAAWKQAVGDEIAAASEIYSLKNGVLTVSVFSSSLLQEIRQFHQDAIMADIRDIWSASMPLVRIIFRLGKK